MDFSKLIFEFEKNMRYKRYSENSIDCYKSCILSYLNYFQEYPQRINQQQIKDYLYELTIIGKSPQLVIQVISSLKKFYKLNGQPFKLKGIDNPRVFEKLIQPLSVSQTKGLINSFDNIKHRAIIQTIYSGGLRRSYLPRTK